MPDSPPTPGELLRGLVDVKAAIDQLASRVMTVDLWRAERESLEIRLREAEKDIAELQATRRVDREKREAEREAEDTRRRSDRRLIFTALIAPAILVLLQLWVASQGAGVMSP